MTLIGEGLLQQVNIEDFSPGKVLAQLQEYPFVFEFLRSKESALGKVRPVVTFMCALSIWAFKQVAEPRRGVPSGLLFALWDKIAGRKDVGEMVEEMEGNLWRYFVDLLHAANKKEPLSDKEIGTGALVYAVVLMGLIFVFWPQDKLPLLQHLLER